MVAFNFKPGFVPLILSGQKIQTIRKTRRCKVGDVMHLYTGQRTSSCRKIADVRCVVSDYVHLEKRGIVFGNAGLHPTVDKFAQLDGFRDYDDMLSWFQSEYGTPNFIGCVHRWSSPEQNHQWTGGNEDAS